MSGPGAVLERPAGDVGLGEVLANRERRVARQRAALARWQRPIVSLTLVIPGPRKDFPGARFLLQEAVRALEDLLADRGWPEQLASLGFEPTGPETLHAVAADPLELKRALADLERSHPLGRLWDLDVLCPVRGAISRKDLGLPPRRCLVCDQPAHACARSRAHPLPVLAAAVEHLLKAGHARG
jgi:holo-ACP synthase